jgi:hypothetical protein
MRARQLRQIDGLIGQKRYRTWRPLADEAKITSGRPVVAAT